MKTILVTGGHGFIGRNLVEHLTGGYRVFAPGLHELNLLDGGETRAYLARHRFDVVIHAATWNATATSTKDQGMVLQSNLRMFFNIMRCQSDFGSMLNYGSGAEYCKLTMPPRVSETHFGIGVPHNDYGLSKYLQALYIEHADRVYNLRLFGVFGKYEDWRIRFVSNVLCKALFDLPLSIRQNTIFDYLDVADLGPITARLIDHPPAEKSLNVCTGRRVELRAIAQAALDIAGKSLPIMVKDGGYGHEYTGDNSRLLDTLGDFQLLDLHTSMERLYNWYSDHRTQIDYHVLAATR